MRPYLDDQRRQKKLHSESTEQNQDSVANTADAADSTSVDDDSSETSRDDESCSSSSDNDGSVQPKKPAKNRQRPAPTAKHTTASLSSTAGDNGPQRGKRIKQEPA